MEQFAAVAVAHFLALLIPGVDFFLIARTAMTNGWRAATGTCLGIATANGIFIAAAFSGLSLISNPTVLAVIQLAGGVFLLYIGVAFIRSNARFDPGQEAQAVQATWARGFGLGIASGLLNPKNALFYLSLAAALAGASPLTLAAYGVWMFTIVLVWDVFVAIAFGSRQVLTRLERIVPWLTKAAGAFLVLFGLAMITTVSVQLLT
ncbi:LysE family translocator [Propionicicella superfundia]|uniref:LysE family translocator n=1 Tax=Propionicicella superfundia TaxID=348582 RepID=UPI0004134EDC|nr:LysE family translocator [Propionicicella superfundia]